jgi:hypothetical protein
LGSDLAMAKRSIARQLVELLKRYDQPGMEIIRTA